MYTYLRSSSWLNETKAALKRDSNTKLLIQSNTTDGSTTFVDTMGTHSPVQGAATCEHDTDQKKWGASSILFDGDSGYITVPDHADFNLGTGAFTIDVWCRINALPDSEAFLGIFDVLEDAVNRITASFNKVGSNYTISFYANNAGTVHNFYIVPGYSINTWNHIAFIRGWGGKTDTNDGWEICFNGKTYSKTVVVSNPDIELKDYSAALEIGTYDVGGADQWYSGWMDSFAWCKGKALWTRPFAVPWRDYYV